MKDILILQSAEADLLDIQIFYSDISVSAYRNVMADIRATLSILSHSPEIGYIYRNGRRRLITAKYRYVITYRYTEPTVEVLGIYRHQNRS